MTVKREKNNEEQFYFQNSRRLLIGLFFSWCERDRHNFYGVYQTFSTQVNSRVMATYYSVSNKLSMPFCQSGSLQTHRPSTDSQKA